MRIALTRFLSIGPSWRTFALASAVLLRLGPVAASYLFAIKLGPTSYGTITVLIIVVPLATLAATLGLDQAAFRYWVDTTRDPVIAEHVRLSGLAAAGSMIPLTGVAFVVSWLTGIDKTLLVVEVFAGLSQACTLMLVSAWLRARRRGPSYLFLCAAVSLPSLILRLLLLAIAPGGWAWAAGDVLSALVSWAALLIWIRRAAASPVATAAEMRRRQIKYGVPLSLNGVLQWVLGSSDRVIFAAILPASSVGLYGAVYQLAGLYNAAASEVNKSGLHRYVGVTPERLAVVRRRDSVILTAMWVAALLPVIALMLLLQQRGYDGAVPLGLGLYGSLLPLALYLPIANAVSLAGGRSALLTIGTLVGCIVNVAVNLALVGSFGVWAGVVANALGYLLMATVLFALNRRRSAVARR